MEMSQTKEEGSGQGASRAPKIVFVLLVDGDSDFCQSMKSVLRASRGMETVVEMADSAALAMQMFNAGFVPDAIFCGSKIQDMEAENFFGWIQRTYPEWVNRFCMMLDGCEDSEQAIELKKSGCKCMEKVGFEERIEKALLKILADKR